MLNPMKLMKLKGAWDAFNKDHPQFQSFLSAVYPSHLQEGSVLEITATPQSGKPLRYRMTVTERDMALFTELQDLER